MKTAPDLKKSRFRLKGVKSLAFRLTLLYTLTSAGLILFVTGFLYADLSRKLNKEDTQFLADKVFVFRSILANRYGDPEDQREDFKEDLNMDLKREGTVQVFPRIYVRVLTLSGRVIMESRGIPDSLRKVQYPVSISSGAIPRICSPVRVGREGAFCVISARAAFGSHGEDRAILQIALDQTREESLLKDYRYTMALVLIAGILGSAVLGYVLTRMGMSPLTRMIGAIERIRFPQHYPRIVGDDQPWELVPLVDAFNNMLDRLRESFERLSQFSADLAHELRTPINNLRGEAEVTLLRHRSDKEYRHTLESSLEELGRLSRMIDSLLFLARSESDRSLVNLIVFEARQEIEKITSFFEAYAEEKGVFVEVRGSASLRADRELFRRAMGNVLENALNYTPSGGKVVLTVRSGSGLVEIAVVDTGQGIAPEHLPKVFDRFYRVDPARERSDRGAGLGLSLVRSIMALHGGSVGIRSTFGHGTEVLLRFPFDPTSPT